MYDAIFVCFFFFKKEERKGSRIWRMWRTSYPGSSHSTLTKNQGLQTSVVLFEIFGEMGLSLLCVLIHRRYHRLFTVKVTWRAGMCTSSISFAMSLQLGLDSFPWCAYLLTDCCNTCPVEMSPIITTGGVSRKLSMESEIKHKSYQN